jgi:hypothetical protein
MCYRRGGRGSSHGRISGIRRIRRSARCADAKSFGLHEPAALQRPSKGWDDLLEAAMIIETLVTVFVIAFVAIALFGHVLLAQALMTPDQADGSQIGW